MKVSRFLGIGCIIVLCSSFSSPLGKRGGVLNPIGTWQATVDGRVFTIRLDSARLSLGSPDEAISMIIGNYAYKLFDKDLVNTFELPPVTPYILCSDAHLSDTVHLTVYDPVKNRVGKALMYQLSSNSVQWQLSAERHVTVDTTFVIPIRCVLKRHAQ